MKLSISEHGYKNEISEDFDYEDEGPSNRIYDSRYWKSFNLSILEEIKDSEGLNELPKFPKWFNLDELHISEFSEFSEMIEGLDNNSPLIIENSDGYSLYLDNQGELQEWSHCQYCGIEGPANLIKPHSLEHEQSH